MESIGGREHLLHLRMGPGMKVSGMNRLIREMAEAIRYGPTAPYMRAIGEMTRPTVEADSSMLMETFTKANGKMIRLMALENTCIPTALNTKASGRKTSNTARARRPGLTEPVTRVTTLKVKRRHRSFPMGRRFHLRRPIPGQQHPRPRYLCMGRQP